jgi:hypothetical protein
MIKHALAAPACFGVACPLHGGCARYAAVDDSRADPCTLVTCIDGTGYPMFVSLDAAVGPVIDRRNRSPNRLRIGEAQGPSHPAGHTCDSAPTRQASSPMLLRT